MFSCMISYKYMYTCTIDQRQLNQAFSRMTRTEKASVDNLCKSVLNYLQQQDDEAEKRAIAFIVYVRKSHSVHNNLQDRLVCVE